jgi:hypothetical protein
MLISEDFYMPDYNKLLKQGVAVVAIAGAIGGGAVMARDNNRSFGKRIKNTIILPIIQTVGNVAGVNSHVDSTYKDFYLVGLEIAKPGMNVNSAEWGLDSHKQYYLLTAVRENEGNTVQRKFLVTEDQLIAKVGFSKQQLDEIKSQGIGTPEASPNSQVLLPEKKFDFPSRGQYLRSEHSLVDFSVYPRAEDVVVNPADLTIVQKINNDLKSGKVKSGFRTQMKFQP